MKLKSLAADGQRGSVVRMTVLTLLKRCSRSAGADFDRGADEFCPLLFAVPETSTQYTAPFMV